MGIGDDRKTERGEEEGLTIRDCWIQVPAVLFEEHFDPSRVFEIGRMSPVWLAQSATIPSLRSNPA